METKINNAINAFLKADNCVEKESSRQELIDLMQAYPKNHLDCDYWRMRHLAGW